MGILSKMMGTAQGTAARSGRSGRATGRPAMGRKTMGTGRTSGGTARMARRTTAGGRGGAPAASGGLGKLLGSLTKGR